MIAKKYQDFDVVVLNRVNYIAGNWQRLRISEADNNRANELFSDWANAYFQYINETQRTPLITNAIKTVYTEFNTLLNEINQQLKNDKRIELTNEECHHLGIEIRREPHHPPRPPQAPINEVYKTAPSKVTITTTNTINGSTANHRAKPTGVARIGRAVVYTEDDVPPPMRSFYTDLPDSTRMTYTPTTPATAKFGWLITWFINSRNEAGPQSKPLKFAVI